MILSPFALQAAAPPLSAEAAEALRRGGIVAWTIALPLLGFVVNGLIALLRPKLKAVTTLVGPGVIVAAFAIAVRVALQVPALPGRSGILTLWRWLDADRLVVDFALRIDPLSAVMMLVITGVGSLIHIFSVGYMKDDEGYARFFAYLNLFVAFMLVLVLGSSYPVLFIGWEGVGLCSYLLIGFWYLDKGNADAGKKAFLVNRIGDAGFLIAMFLLWWTLGTLDIQGVNLRAGALEPGGAMITLITMLLLLGCTGKSAQIPLYTWLPDAMAGPTPVSALIHAATMVTAGVYLVVRSGPLFAAAPGTLEVMAVVGAATALLAAIVAVGQNDIKKVLAFSTVSQLGYMFLGLGAGASAAAIFHLVTHAFFKALLFLGAGSVIHAMHHALHATHRHDDPQDLRNMGGLARRMPATALLMAVGGLALAGLPPFAGFFSKDEILGAVLARSAQYPGFAICWYMGLAAAFLTAFYTARLLVLAFLGRPRLGPDVAAQLHEAPIGMTGPLAVLGVAAAAGGLLNLPAELGGHHALASWLDPVTKPAAVWLQAPAVALHWGEVGIAVGIAVAGLLAGWVAARRAPDVPARDAAPATGVMRALARRLYVDELYDALIVRPVVWAANHLLWRGVDRGAIDGGVVNGSARFFEGLGWLGSRLQTGSVGLYVMLFVAGALVVLRQVLG